MKKEKILKPLLECANLYKENYCNYNFLYFLKEKNNNYSMFETYFDKANFLHLTGIKILNNKYSARSFYDACLNNKIGLSFLSIGNNGLVALKLDALSHILDRNFKYRIFAEYDGHNINLKTDFLIGNINYCLGFKKIACEKYIPNTVLKRDIREIINLNNKKQISAIYRKKKVDKKYEEIYFFDKNLSSDERIAINNKLN